MVTSEEELALAYLLDPCFQIVNSAGKPLTDGYIEVYYHGTRTKYYCYSDWNGSLHPHKIPLDSLGANIVLASPDFAYDVYVYNKFGSLIMSRYNVTPGQGGGGSGGIPSQYEAEHWLGQYGATQALIGNQTGQTLALPSNPDYQGDFVDHIDYGYINGDETNEYPKYMYLKPGLYLVNCVIRFQQQSGTEVNRLDETLVYTGNGNANEDVAWQLDETGPLTTGDRHCLKLTFIRKVLDEGETSPVDCSNILYFAPGPSVNWNDAYIQTLQIVKLNSAVGGGGGAMMLKPGPGISIDEEAVISVTGMQPVSGMDQYVTVNYFGDTITNVTGDIYNIVSGVTGDINDVSEVVNNVTGDITEITNVVNNVTGDVTEITNIVNGVTGDIEQLNTDIQAVSAALPDAQIQSDWNETDPESKAYIQNKPDLSVYATHSEVTGDIQNVTSVINQEIINITGDIQSVSADAQVQSDWTENDSSDLAYIKNKPEEVTLVAGENVTLTRSGTNLTISAAGGDLSNYVTHSELESVTGDINTEITNVSVDIQNITTVVNNVTGNVADVSGQIAQVSAAVADIPEQVNADWDATEGKAEILNKPELSIYATHDELANVSGEIMNNVTGDIADVTNIIYNVTGDIQNIEGDITNLTTVVNGVTGDVQTVSADVQAVSAAIPNAQVQSDWTELDTDSKAYIQHKPETSELTAGQNITITEVNGQIVISSTGGGGGSGDVTHADLEAVSAQLEADIQTVSAAIPDVSIFATEADLQIVSGELNAATGVLEGEIQTVSAAIPDISDLATKAEVDAAIDTVTGMIPDVSDLATEAELQIVSAAIPEVAQADWAATGGPSEILNKPTEKNLVAGENVTISIDGDDVIVETTEMASGMQVVAGEGVKLTVSGNYLIASTDETVIYNSAGETSFSTSEPITNFERVIFYVTDRSSSNIAAITVPMLGNNLQKLVLSWTTNYDGSLWKVLMWCVTWSSSNMKDFTISTGYYAGYNTSNTWQAGDNISDIKILKVIGINRIAS